MNGRTADIAWSAAQAQTLIPLAHSKNVRVLLCVGGASSSQFPSAITATNRPKFVAGLMNLVKTYGYDGLDLDAASLHVGLSGLLDPGDERFGATVTAIEAELPALRMGQQ